VRIQAAFRVSMFGIVSCAMAATTACKSRAFNTTNSSFDNQKKEDLGNINSEMFDLWNTYVQEEQSAGLQEPCEPKLYRPSDHNFDGTPRGVALLFSGYSSCPYQYTEIGPMLASKGFFVFTPVNPGHGRNPTSKGPDLSEVPTYSVMPFGKNTWTRYQDFVNRMVKMIQVGTVRYPTSGNNFQRVVMGLSVGGAEATYALIGNQKNFFDRALIAAPFYSAPEGAAKVALAAISNTLIAKYKDVNWGPACERDMKEGTPKKGGFCSFEYQHLGAVQTFGTETFNNLKLQGHEVVQFVGVDEDKAISQKMLLDAVAKVKPDGKGAGAKAVHACSYGVGVPHAFISRTDNQLDKDNNPSVKPWLPEFEKDAVAFLTEGAPFRTKNSATSSVLTGFDMCEMP
jgi:hypothetical protein